MSTPGPEPTVKDSKIIDAIERHEYPVVSQKIVAEEVGLSPERVRIRLRRLMDSGPVQRAELNENSVVYWVEQAD